jgi:CRISPR/Cas system-associated endoribonuclease Cas2
MISPIPASGRRSPTCAWINRIQYSAFAGWLSRNHQEELMKQAVRCLGRQAGRIYLYCIAEREWRLRLEYGRSDAAPGGDIR